MKELREQQFFLMSIFLVIFCTRAELIQVQATESYGTTLETGSAGTNVTYTLYDNNADGIECAHYFSKWVPAYVKNFAQAFLFTR